MTVRKRNAGFTLLEVLVSLTLFSVLGYGVLLALGVGRQSQDTVEELVDEAQAIRGASNAILDDLRATNAAHLSIDVLPDGNHSVRMQASIEVGGAITWGVHERELGPTPAEQDQAGWFVRYLVVDTSIAGGAVEKQLVRQVLDAGGELRLTRTLARGLRAGGGDAPGFRLVQQGAVWEVTLSTAGVHAGQPRTRMIFHAQSRNEST